MKRIILKDIFLFSVLIVMTAPVGYYIYFFIYLYSHQWALGENLQIVISLIVTPFLFLGYSKIFSFFIQPSTWEKQDYKLKYELETLLCSKHYVRVVRNRRGLLYSFFECPIVGCGRQHMISGVQELVGIIENTRFFEIQQNDTMFLSLWNQESKQSRYGEIDRLEIHYVETFTEEDYNQAIQSVVSKIHNSMPEDKRKKVQVKVESEVKLSEASRRLLQGIFGSYQEGLNEMEKPNSKTNVS